MPPDGPSVTFRLSLDDQLAHLDNAEQIIEHLRDVEVVFRSIAAVEPETEQLDVRRRDAASASWIGRPESPTLIEALERHPFLEFESERARLRVREGDWIVSGDLVLPSGVPLYAEGPVHLRFEEDAVLLTDAPLIFEGNWTTPVVLEPVEGAASWGGIAVIESQGRSTWQHARIRRTNSVERAGWTTTGGINFYRSPVTMQNCFIDGTLAEDGASLIGTDFLLNQVTFAECASDSLDGDFVTGKLIDCIFRDGLADGVDFSTSDVDVIGCTFRSLGDKAISAGERSVIRVERGFAADISIGIASTDESRVDLKGMTIRDARTYALAVFVKQPGYGPASLVATNLSLQAEGRDDLIVQTGCVVEIDGNRLPTQDIDAVDLKIP